MSTLNPLRYRAFASMALRGPLQENPFFVLQYGFAIVETLLLLALWRAAYGGHRVVGGLTLPQVLTYTLMAHVLSAQLRPDTEFAGDMWEGRVAVRFLRPVSVFGQYVAETLGRWLFRVVLFAAPVLALATVLGVDPRPRGSVPAFVVSLGCSIVLGFAVDLCIAALMIWFEHDYWSVQMLSNAVVAFASGFLVPLALLPFGVGRVLEWLPFASMVSAPLRIYVGAGGDPWPLVARQAAWAVVAWPVAAGLWRMLRQRMVLYGG